MNRPPRVCVVGSTNMDLTFRTPRLPIAAETLIGQSFHLGHGGKGANQAVMAARLGAEVAFVSRVGRDVFGEQALANLRTQGIDTRFVSLDDQRASGVASILVDDQARNCILVVPGANLGLSPQDVRDAAEAIRAADVVICQLEVPLETVLEVFRIARECGVRTILNPAPVQRLPEELLQLTDVCVPNEGEAAGHSHITMTGGDYSEAAARILRSKGPKAVLVTLGEKGVLVLDDDGPERLPAPQVRAVDTSGAGDAFVGSFAVLLAESCPLREAAQRANIVAALSVTRLGTQASYPRRSEIEAFAVRVGLTRW
jgi:ribokinase